jgi:hypothetical protein
VNATTLIFHPPRRLGLILQGALIAVLALACLWSIWQMTETAMGPVFLRYLLLAGLCLLPLPTLVYRFRALQRAQYILERDGIRLRWGLRAEDIPMDQVQWVHPREDLLSGLPLPPVRWPGAVLGSSLRPLAGAGRVEFLASTTRDLVLIGTPRRVFAISPENAAGFLESYQRLTELGSLSPIAAHSEQPVNFLAETWRRPAVRLLFGAAALLSLILFAWVIVVIPGLEGIYLGATGAATELLPAAALLLLPFLNIIFQVLDWALGLFLFRQEEHRPLAYILWGSSVISAAMFLVTVGVILSFG